MQKSVYTTTLTVNVFKTIDVVSSYLAPSCVKKQAHLLLKEKNRVI